MLLIFNKAGLLGAFFSYGLSINSLLAAFNLLPVRPFDGISVLKWNKVVYAFAAISAGMLFVASWFL
jgi:Zn-dependent protease